MEPTPEQIDLKRSLRRDKIADPDVLFGTRRRVQERHADSSREWDRLDHNNPQAVLRQPELARQMLADAKEEERITAAIAVATRQQAAFLELADYERDIRDQKLAVLDLLIDHPPADDVERRETLELLGDLDRLHLRLLLSLRAVSTSARFKEPVAALSQLKNTLEARIREIDRLPVRVPGLKPKFSMPPDIAALLDALEGRTPQKEMAHAG
jgi:hypothetical protein